MPPNKKVQFGGAATQLCCRVTREVLKTDISNLGAEIWVGNVAVGIIRGRVRLYPEKLLSENKKKQEQETKNRASKLASTQRWGGRWMRGGAPEPWGGRYCTTVARSGQFQGVGGKWWECSRKDPSVYWIRWLNMREPDWVFFTSRPRSRQKAISGRWENNREELQRWGDGEQGGRGSLMKQGPRENKDKEELPEIKLSSPKYCFFWHLLSPHCDWWHICDEQFC